MSGKSADSQANRTVVLGALALILLTTTVWWALALWPLSGAAPAWLVRTRAVCFGAAPRSLPDAAGWVALFLQPALMLGTLMAVWGREVRVGTRALLRGWPGRAALGLLAVALLAGAGGAAARVVSATSEAASVASGRVDVALERLNRDVPSFALIDQHGEEVSFERFRGRPVLVTFGFAHCETVCPLTVTETLRAQRRFAAEANRPAVVVITLDPWRDTPARLAHIASAWDLGRDAYVLSGTRDDVNRALDAWRVPRERNESTGDIVHPALVYVVDAAGRITYSAPGNSDLLVELLKTAGAS